MEDIVGNLGEPLDFAEHHMDEVDAQDDGTNADTERQYAADVSWATGVANAEAESSSGRSSYNVDADVLDISGGKPKVRSIDGHARQSIF